MKKFIIILIILLLIGGCLFFFGWIQILLPAETFAVIFTKTGGFDSEVTRPGVFSWRWERLIPTNMKIYKFDLHPYETEAAYRSSLPSSEHYSSILPENPDFDFEASISVKFELKPESLPALVKEEKLTPETLLTFYEEKAQKLAQKIMELSFLSQQSLEGQSSLLPNVQWDKQLKQELAEHYPDLRIIHLNSKTMKIPDLELYSLAKESYRSLVRTRDESRNAASVKLAEELEKAKIERRKEEISLQTLREYGELLTQYPILLKAIYVQKISGNEKLDIPELEIPAILESSNNE